MKQRFSKRTRLVSMLLALAMVFTFLPMGSITAAAASGDVAVNATNFPDAVFRDRVKWKIADGSDTLTEQQRNQLQELVLPQGIKDLKGIEYFENLEKLEGATVGLKYLDVSKNKKLKYLDVNTNQLEYLKVTENTGLEYLHCGSNHLTELDVTRNRRLSKLWCYNNQFTELDVSKNSDLIWLGCGSNSLTELDVSRNPKLEILLCFDNQLTELNLSKNTALTELDCSGNHLTSLELTSYIKDKDFKADGNVYDITIDRTDRTFDLSRLPGNFKPGKVRQWNGGSVKSGTSILTVDKGVSQVTYTYDCGFNRKAVFTLRVTETGSAPVDPPASGEYKLTVKNGIARVDHTTGTTLNIASGRVVCITVDKDSIPAGMKFEQWVFDNYDAVASTLSIQPDGAAIFKMPKTDLNVYAKLVVDTSGGGSTGGGSTGGSTGGDGGGGGGAVILLAGGAALLGGIGIGVYNYVTNAQLKALLPAGTPVPQTRGETALLLWNTAGRPHPIGTPAFVDVADPDTAKAAQWCVEAGIMDWKSNDQFAPDKSISRSKVLKAYKKLVG